MCILRDLRRFVIPDVRVQRRDQHQRALQVLINLFTIELDARNAILHKTVRRVVQQTDRMEEVMNHHWLVDI